ncbi:cellulose synthase subunit BcsC-related outer membrane protein [Photobacterium galatheae]|uniref:Cellulose synthase n=2 Tax=Photobacterium galatheae TaxID=1654360 RepID=A0A066RRG6_9GAMM|nr:cellulose synthase subunit BcsC-related outer membrane protein [Photobacterium galatheae]KDM89998.1 cellulose synthase [Photobacterium galatheae]MCM0149976.1 BCSC C-terminal domain-containing protein [Photobacterium galatheae]
MSVNRFPGQHRLVTLSIGSLFVSQMALAGIVPDTPLTPAQLKQVYQPVTPVRLSTSLVGVDSVAFLVEQIALATALNRDDIVVSALERLFAIDSQQPEGLYYQARLFLKQQQPDQAQAIVNQLKVGSSQRAALNDLIAIHGPQKAALQQARLLAHAGRYPEALKAYRQLFPNGMPSAELQLEYLQVEGNLRERWNAVKQGLEQLNAAYPGVPGFQLALANHIRRRDPADPWMLNTYRQLALRSDIGPVAAEAWLRALKQLPISQAVADQYAIVASYYPSDMAIQRASQDAQVRWKTEQELRKDPTYQAKRRGLALLENGQDQQAKRQLTYALTTRPKDPEILGGLGMVYLRQGQQKKALRFFQQAQALDNDPDHVRKWQSLIETASYWAYLDDGDAHQDNGQMAQADRAYRKAIAADDRAPYAYHKLAALLLAQQKFEAADQAYQQALQRDAGNETALRGRVNVREAQGGLRAAIAFVEGLSPRQRHLLSERLSEMKTQLAVQQLNQALVSQDLPAAERYANELLTLNPTSAWQRRDIADALVAVGKRAQADRLMRHWSAATTDPEMQFAYALYLAQADQLSEAVTVLSRVPISQRTDAMQRNLTRLQLNQSLSDIADRYQTHPEVVRSQLNALSQQYADQPEVLTRLAVVWADLGERQRAETMYRSMTPDAQWSESAQLSYGGLMITLAKFSDFDPWLAEKGQQRLAGELDASWLAGLDELHSRRVLAEADLRLAQGQHDTALTLYQQILGKPEPFQTEAEAGVLQAAALSGHGEAYQRASQRLFVKRATLSARQLMAVAPVMNAQGETARADALNLELDLRADADAMDYRNAMAIAMENKQWALAEQRGYQALNADRIEKSPDAAAGKASPELRDLYQDADDNWLTRNVKADIDRLRDRSDGHVIIGWDYSARDGKNTSSQIPIEARIPMEDWNGHLLLRADYVHVDSDHLDYFEKQTGRSVDSDAFRSQASGMALALGWQAENWTADIGTTPLGFDHSTWVGGVTVDNELGDFGVSVTASRRPETSTVLSYAGMQVPDGVSDPAGTAWGGVVRTGIKLSSSWDTGGPYGFWNSLQYHQMTGENVMDNTRLAVLGGAYYKLIATDDQRLSLGTNLLYFHYDKNLGEYTLGSGGYYSPQRYVSLSLPVNYYGRYGNSLSYRVGGSLSHSWSKEDAPYASAGEASTGGGFGYSLEGAIEQRISERWYLGASLDLQRSDFYEPNHLMLYMKYTFSDRWQPIEYPPAVPQLYSDFD